MLVKKKIDFSKEKTNNANWRVEEKINIENIGFEDLYGLLKEIDKNLEKGNADVAFNKRILTLNTHLEEKIYMNSDGTMIKSRIPRLSFHSYITTS